MAVLYIYQVIFYHPTGLSDETTSFSDETTVLSDETTKLSDETTIQIYNKKRKNKKINNNKSGGRSDGVDLNLSFFS